MSEQRCHEEVVRDGEYAPCNLPATGWAWDDEGGSLYPACERHAQGAASEVERLTQELGRAQDEIRRLAPIESEAATMFSRDEYGAMAARAESAERALARELVRRASSFVNAVACMADDKASEMAVEQQRSGCVWL